ncbi:MAG: guanylate kinase [Kiritimatiellae bacterium]|nr:guanylate kinase [Kiritimatiellia bacterium]
MQTSFRQPVFLVLTAPSGAGKTTLVNLLRAEFDVFDYSVSCTTRAPRGEEKDGVAYHFLSDEEFLRRVAAGEFLEHAMVHGHRYGTLKSAVEGPMAGGRSVLLDIDVAGAAQVRDIVRGLPPDAPLARAFLDVFIDVPSLEELRRRLEKRGEDAPDVIERRLRNAEGERARRGEFSAIVVNDDLATAHAELRALVLRKACG